jgi:DNA-binding NarL/FixJ family response regulator
VFLADDHQAMRERVVKLLATECDVVGTATDGRETIVSVTKLKPDVLVLDITMHDLSGIEVARRLKEDGVGLPIVFLTVHEDPEFAKEAIEIGALGYVIKPRMASDLMVAVMEAHAGRSFVSPSVLSAMD